MDRHVMVAMIIVLLLLALGVVIKNNSEVVAGVEQDELILDNLKVCCNYFENGEQKSCSILEKYDCSLCDAKCG